MQLFATSSMATVIIVDRVMPLSP